MLGVPATAMVWRRRPIRPSNPEGAPIRSVAPGNTSYAPVAQLGEPGPKVRWTFAARRTGEPERGAPGSEPRSARTSVGLRSQRSEVRAERAQPARQQRRVSGAGPEGARPPGPSNPEGAPMQSVAPENTSYAPVAQLDRALASGAKGQRFESSRARQMERVTLVVALCICASAQETNLRRFNRALDNSRQQS
jgi:hypothetical protein